MWKNIMERVAERVARRVNEELSLQLKDLVRRVEVLERNPRDLEDDELGDRLAELEKSYEAIVTDWALAKRQLMRLHGQITKAAAIDSRQGPGEISTGDTAEDVLRLARSKGLTR